jgi:uncharacterized membrane protein
MALFAHPGTIELGWVAPLIIYLKKKETSKFAAFHALQSLYFQLVMIVAHFAAFAVTFVICGLGVFATVIMAIIFAVSVGLKAHKGEWAEYPLVAGWARNSVFGKS